MPEVKLSKISEKPDGSDLTPADFVHLHNHTHYSLLDGLTKVPDLIDFVKSSGMEAVAVTDHGTMCGLVELYKVAYDNDIKPILGLEAYVAARKLTDKDPAHDKERVHITLLAMNEKVYENLCRLATESELHGMYYKPRIDHELMEKYNEGIICLSGCASSEISVNLKEGNYQKARELVDWYSKIYKDRFYLEMQDHGHPDSPTHWEVQKRINEGLQKLAKETGLPLVVTCDGHYLKHEDRDAHEILLCVGTASNLSDPNRMSLKDFELHVIPPDQIIERWGKDFPEAIRNTKRIAERCNVDLQLGRILIPKFPGIPDGDDEKSYLDKLVFRGLVFRYGGKTEEEAKDLSVEECRRLLPDKVLERIDYELSVVDKMGYNGSFLIVQYFINWGKKKRIVYGPGRGSAAGSILAYALRITELDPLKYDLLFERFLNPDRISMPDIDTDIQDTRRDEVIQYCTDKYGRGRVSNIVTFGKMMAKNAVRDVARVLEVPYAESDRIAKLVPDPVMGHHVKLTEAIEKVPDLRHEYATNPTAKDVIDYAAKLEGTIRSHGVHACGVIIAPDDLVKFLPLEVAKKKGTGGEEVLSAQFPMTQVEELGLLKMDFLGLSNLSVINNALRMIRKVYGDDLDMYSVPLDDKPTYELLQRAETTGVFQLESGGMKKYLRDLQASTFEDMIAMVALYRPGPMQFIDSFIRRKHGKEPITYLHPGLEEALKPTYGILIYQEQFMQISRTWCGFTGGQSDTLRKAVGKKKVDLMNKLKPQFIEGAVKIGGATEEIAETFWNQLLDFANYSFNKSHAARYALIAYWTAYLKAHYPDAFMAALMTSDMRWTDRLAIEISECKHMGIKVLGPDINQSYGDFGIVKGEKTIRFGLSGIKSMGKALVEEEVIPERDKNGPFKSVYDFAKRVNASKFNKRSWEAAIKTGAFDSFKEKDKEKGVYRSELLFNLESIQGYGNKVQKDTSSGQTDLFGAFGAAGEIPEPELKPAPVSMSEKEMLLNERDLMGLYLSSHPLDKYDDYFEEQTHPFSLITPENNNKIITIGGIITDVRTIITKKGDKMAFVKIESKSAEQEIIAFPNVFAESGAKLVVDNVVRVTGKINATDQSGNITSDIKILAESVEPVSDEILNNYHSTGTKLPAPVSAPPRNSRNGRRAFRGSSSVPSSVRELRRAQPASPVTTGASAAGLAASAAPGESASAVSTSRLFCLINDPNDADTLSEIKHLCDLHPGPQEIILVLAENGEKRPLKMPFKVSADDELTAPLEKLLGKDCVKLV
ncbi:DNA polymerase III subunit alpha [Candidatus Saccharibacteria bacterium]|nr:DNA polymerase III subunit alpha [Candidatus Saccharibacteria bacterium]